MTSEPAGLDALTPQPAAALAFRCGWALARVHPYLLAGTILPSSTRLRDAIHGAALLTSVRVSMSAEHSEKAETWRRLIENLTWMMTRRLSRICCAFRCRGGTSNCVATC